jgi:glycerol kinase
MLYNIVEDRWDADLLKLLNIPISLMPEVCWSSEPLGRVTTSLGLGEVEIAGIAGDQQSALFGQLCTAPGDAKNTYGTGCFLLQNIGPKFTLSKHRLITTLACSTDKKLEYALEGSIFVGGAVVQWLRDNMQFVPAFTGLGAPHWDPYASGLIIGIQRSTQIGNIARAALESIAFQVTDVLQAMNRDVHPPFRELRVDGGAAANDLLMQFQSDLLQLPVRRPAVLETTAQGAAYLAGLAVNFWSSTAEIAKLRGPDTIFQPQADAKQMQARQAKWQDAVQRSRGWNKPD